MPTDFADSISDTIEKGMDDVSGVAADARARLEEAESQARSFIQEYPLGSLAAAVVVGYVVARLLPRI
jgi:ElaB/YqjD/DUF883 family membrane-anchored ribosome-binding protein